MKITKLYNRKPSATVCLSLVITMLMPINTLLADNHKGYIAKITHTDPLYQDSLAIGFEILIRSKKQTNDANNIRPVITSVAIRNKPTGIAEDDCTNEKVSSSETKARFLFNCKLPEKALRLLDPGLSTLKIKLEGLTPTDNLGFPIPVTGTSFMQDTGTCLTG